MLYQLNHIGSLDYCKREYGKNFNFPPHMHQCFEFVTILSGEMTVTVENSKYKLSKGESVLIFPNQIHSLSSVNCQHMLCIFSPKLVAAFSSKTNMKKPVDNRFCPSEHIVDSIDKLNDDTSVYERKGLLYILCGEFDKSAEYVQGRGDNKNLLEVIFHYIDENFSEDCTLKDLSKSIGYDYAYLSRYFKNTVGIPFNKYVNVYRLNNACYLLNNNNDTVLSCAVSSGYKSLRSFNRNFKEQFGMSPTEYIRKFR